MDRQSTSALFEQEKISLEKNCASQNTYRDPVSIDYQQCIQKPKLGH